MASIARCLRAARPSTLSRLAQVPRTTYNWQPATLRAFSASPIRDIRKYTKDHEWIDLNADKTAGVIGISQYAAEELGDVVYVELPEEGKVVSAGDAIGAVESVKSAADINAPIACKVTSVNLALEEKPGTINQVPEDDSHGGGWIVKVQVGEQGVKDFDALMTLEEYNAFTGEEEH
ncbi:glycine cleavage system H protein-like protein [Daldinia caldariorum]|uniref:glycine cleavage system H protein-like protein n=1 Tax=Daldinia caldariorum TaxID=326644 RepID=UPI00200835DD|nr:glycine cleavage system H protein-like protein [Daldinia caldariorum]KAI1469809.1 glycine cleavage system H protein-like protein [Daldinia caldariorum]